MKENSLTSRVVQRNTTPHIKTPQEAPKDSENFSPERIQDQVSTKSAVLIKILEREETTYYSRHWGINE